MRWLAAARIVPLVAYPLIVYFALDYIEAKYLALLLLVVLVVRYRSKARVFMRGMEHAAWIGAAVMALFIAAVWWSNDEYLLRLYPALMATMVLTAFAYTLRRPPSMIERFARLQHDDLPPEAVAYTRRVTQVWCLFLLVNAAIAAYSALFLSRAAWAFYCGFLSYVLMGVLFVGEWLFRRYRYGKEAVS